MTDNGKAIAQNGTNETAHDFDVETMQNFGPDRRTRVRLYATGVSATAVNSNPNNDIVVNGVVQPNRAESVAVEVRLANGSTYYLPVEFAGIAGTLQQLDQVSVILIPELRGAGTVTVTIIINEQRSNSGTLIIH